MIEIPEELKAKLLDAKSAEEVARLIKESGREITEEEISPLWDEIEKYHNKPDIEEFSAEELETISGGVDRDWLEVGCAATVEPGSWCGSNDYCYCVDVTYVNTPNKRCPYCGGWQIFQDIVELRKPGVIREKQYWCSVCQQYEYVPTFDIPNGI